MSHRFCSTFAVVASALSLFAVSVTVSRFQDSTPHPQVATGSGAETDVFAFLDNDLPLVHVANVPSPIMFHEESQPIIDLLNQNDIMWASGGSLSHSLSVSKSRTEDARKLLQENFPWVRLTDSDADPK